MVCAANGGVTESLKVPFKYCLVCVPEHAGDMDMNEKTRSVLCQLINSVIFAGMILLITGVYYWVIKAGIPYQDPPLELQIQYAVNMRIGEILTGRGFLITVCGGAIHLLVKLIWKKH